MAKKKEEMTPEEHQAVIENMAKIRAMAIEKRKEMAKPKQELKEQRQELRNELIMKEAEKLQKLKKVEEKKIKQIEALDKELTAQPVLPDPLPEFEPPPLAEHQKTRKASMHTPIDPYNGFGGMGQMFLYEQFREQLKSKYKQKYKEKYAPKPVMPAEPMTSPVADTAKEQLKAKIDAEIKQMAYQSLFGKPF